MDVVNKLAQDKVTAGLGATGAGLTGAAKHSAEKQAGIASKAKTLLKFLGGKGSSVANKAKRTANTAKTLGIEALSDYTSPGGTANLPGGYDWRKQKLLGMGDQSKLQTALDWINPANYGANLNAMLFGNTDSDQNYALNPKYKLKGTEISGSPFRGGEGVKANIGTEGVLRSPRARSVISEMNKRYGGQLESRDKLQRDYLKNINQSSEDLTTTENILRKKERGLGLSPQNRKTPESYLERRDTDIRNPLQQRVAELEEQLKLQGMSPQERQAYQLQKQLKGFDLSKPMTGEQWQQYTALQKQLENLQADNRSEGAVGASSTPGSLPGAKPYQGAYRVGNDVIIFVSNPDGSSRPVRVPANSIPRLNYTDQSP